MTAEATGHAPLLRFALEGDRVRRAAKVLERESPRLVAALRRAVPFLSRRGVPITLCHARAMPIADLLESLERPIHVAHLVTKPGQAAGALLLDAGAVALFLDGVLGGDGQSLPTLNPSGLSAPQTALMAGLSNNIVRAFSATLEESIGLGLELREASLEQAQVESAPIACVLELGEGTRVGRIALLLAKEPLLTEAPDTEPTSAPARDERIAGVLENVELLLIAELGRVLMRVGDIAALAVGDTLRLDVPVSGLVSVSANGHELMRGRPTTSAGRIAVKVVPRHDA
jgi:flagellar motor switch protein FliM